MSVTVDYVPEGPYVRVQVTGDPSLGEFLGVLQELGRRSLGWTQKLVLIDLRGVLPVYSFTEQFTIGEEVGRSLQHLTKLASVVPAGRATHVSEKAANHRGVTVRVFEDESAALGWLGE